MRYTKQQLEFLKDGYLSMRVPDLTIAFNKAFDLNKSQTQIRAALSNHKFKCHRPTGMPKGSSWLFTDDQIEYIKQQYPFHDHRILTAMVNEKFDLSINISQMRHFVHNHKINSGRTGCYAPGHLPWNTGTKEICKSNSGSFKKGSTPPNLKPIGHERICSKDGYILVKVNEPNPYTGAATRYRPKHIIVWEKENGPKPKGMIVAFIDGNKLNCDIRNLECISQAENLRRNQLGIADATPEIRNTIRALAKLDTQRFALADKGGQQ